LDNDSYATNSNTQTSTKNRYQKIINELYMSIVDAIKNLYDVATKLQTPGKLIFPGDLTV